MYFFVFLFVKWHVIPGASLTGGCGPLLLASACLPSARGFALQPQSLWWNWISHDTNRKALHLQDSLRCEAAAENSMWSGPASYSTAYPCLVTPPQVITPPFSSWKEMESELLCWLRPHLLKCQTSSCQPWLTPNDAAQSCFLENSPAFLSPCVRVHRVYNSRYFGVCQLVPLPPPPSWVSFWDLSSKDTQSFTEKITGCGSVHACPVTQESGPVLFTLLPQIFRDFSFKEEGRIIV